MSFQCKIHLFQGEVINASQTNSYSYTVLVKLLAERKQKPDYFKIFNELSAIRYINRICLNLLKDTLWVEISLRWYHRIVVVGVLYRTVLIQYRMTSYYFFTVPYSSYFIVLYRTLSYLIVLIVLIVLILVIVLVVLIGQQFFLHVIYSFSPLLMLYFKKISLNYVTTY